MNLRAGDKLHLSLSTLADMVETDLTRDSDGDVVDEAHRKVCVTAIIESAGKDGVIFKIENRRDDL